MSFKDLIRHFRTKITPGLIKRFTEEENRSPYHTYYLNEFYGIVLRSAHPIERYEGETVSIRVDPNLLKIVTGQPPVVNGFKITVQEETDKAHQLVSLHFGTFTSSGQIDNAETVLIQLDKKQGVTGFVRFATIHPRHT